MQGDPRHNPHLKGGAAALVCQHVKLVHDHAAQLLRLLLRDQPVDRRVALFVGAHCDILACACKWAPAVWAAVRLHPEVALAAEGLQVRSALGHCGGCGGSGAAKQRRQLLCGLLTVRQALQELLRPKRAQCEVNVKPHQSAS